MNYNDKLERLRMKLYKTIDERGLDAPETQRISERLDRLIIEQYEHEIEYPYGSDIKEAYYRSIQILKDTTKDTGHFPAFKEWNTYAYKNNLLCHLSIEYISKMNWCLLEKYIRLQIK